jgi:hypothetical protein
MISSIGELLVCVAGVAGIDLHLVTVVGTPVGDVETLVIENMEYPSAVCPRLT